MPLVRLDYICDDCKFKTSWTTLALFHVFITWLFSDRRHGVVVVETEV